MILDTKKRANGPLGYISLIPSSHRRMEMAGLAGGHLLTDGPLLPRHLLRHLHQPLDLFRMALGQHPITGLLLAVYSERNGWAQSVEAKGVLPRTAQQRVIAALLPKSMQLEWN